MTELELYIHSYFGIDKNDLDKISSYFQLTTLARGDYFLKPDRICDKLSFHKSGLIRVYALADGKEITQWISTTGYFVTDLNGIMFNKPSRYTIQALTDCELYTIPLKEYQNLGRHIPQWHHLEKLFIARCFTFLEERIFNLLSMDTEQRYQALMRQSPELFNLVPLQYLASMMGMTPETLSRLRKKEATRFTS